MNITVVGTGYVGLIAAICFTDFGHHVVGYDQNAAVAEKLQSGECHIYEPGAESYLERGLASGRLRFTASREEAVRGAEAVFMCVGTPETADGSADLSQLYAAAEAVAAVMDGPLVFVNKSTVPVGTGKKMLGVINGILAERGVSYTAAVVSNPEFLREGRAVNDFMNPDRIVIGAHEAEAAAKIKKLYSVFERSNKAILITNLETAEMIKCASNAFLATKITFINEIANLCEKTGANIRDVARGMGLDGRIGSKFLHAGPGYGGSCFPKDTKALLHVGNEYGVPLSIVGSVIEANQAQKRLAADKILATMPKGGTLAILGLAFKPETDDVRESPALEIIRLLAASGDLTLKAYDPEAMDNARAALKDIAGRVEFCASAGECLSGCDGAAVVTEWLEFRNRELYESENIRYIYDLRNIFAPDDMRSMGKRYFGTGIV